MHQLFFAFWEALCSGRTRAFTGGVDENAHQFPNVLDARDVGNEVSFSFSIRVVRLGKFVGQSRFLVSDVQRPNHSKSIYTAKILRCPWFVSFQLASTGSIQLHPCT